MKKLEYLFCVIGILMLVSTQEKVEATKTVPLTASVHAAPQSSLIDRMRNSRVGKFFKIDDKSRWQRTASELPLVEKELIAKQGSLQKIQNEGLTLTQQQQQKSQPDFKKQQERIYAQEDRFKKELASLTKRQESLGAQKAYLEKKLNMTLNPESKSPPLPPRPLPAPELKRRSISSIFNIFDERQAWQHVKRNTQSSLSRTTVPIDGKEVPLTVQEKGIVVALVNNPANDTNFSLSPYEQLKNLKKKNAFAVDELFHKWLENREINEVKAMYAVKAGAYKFDGKSWTFDEAKLASSGYQKQIEMQQATIKEQYKQLKNRSTAGYQAFFRDLNLALESGGGRLFSSDKLKLMKMYPELQHREKLDAFYRELYPPVERKKL